jgi:hypothetical protein
MGDWSIDRFALTLPGYSEREGRELSHYLSVALLELAADPGGPRAEHVHLKLELTAHEGEALPELARRIAAALAATG